MAILDQFGRPFETAQLRESQTSRFAFLQREFQGHPSRGLTPEKLASILQQAEQGDLLAQAELWQDMEEKDGHIFAELHKRKLALVGLDWDVLPPLDASAAEKTAAKDLKRILEDEIDLGDIVMDMANAIGVAYSCQEITWRRDGRGWLPEQIEFQEASWFTIDQATRKQLRLRNGSSIDGEELWPFGWIVHIQKSKSGYLGRAGLGRVLAWPFLFKNYAAQDLAEFCRVYGLPTKLGKYPAGADATEKSTLLKALLSIGHNAAGIMPQGMDVELLAAAQGQSDPFEFSLQFWNGIESKVILGTALATETGPNGNRSLGDIGNEIRKDIRNSDAKQHAKTLTRDLVYPVGVLNGLIKDPRRLPRLVFDTQEPEDLKLYSEALPKLVEVGLPVTVAQVQEKLKLRPPEEGEAVLQRAAPAAAAADNSLPRERGRAGEGASSAAATAHHNPGCCGPLDAIAALAAPAPTGRFPDQAALDGALAALTDENLQSQMEALLQPVLRLAQTQPEQLMARLATLYPELDDAALAEQLARVMFVAETWGRLHG
jgi:phage gp29-like protein